MKKAEKVKCSIVLWWRPSECRLQQTQSPLVQCPWSCTSCLYYDSLHSTLPSGVLGGPSPLLEWSEWLPLGSCPWPLQTVEKVKGSGQNHSENYRPCTYGLHVRCCYFSTHCAFSNLNHFKNICQHCLSFLEFFAAISDEIERDRDLKVCLEWQQRKQLLNFLLWKGHPPQSQCLLWIAQYNFAQVIFMYLLWEMKLTGVSFKSWRTSSM